LLFREKLQTRKNFTLAPIFKKCAKNYSELYPPKEKMLRIVFGTFFGILEPKRKKSEIKPPLSVTRDIFFLNTGQAKIPE
jgi:hypothetical protein